MDRAAAEAWISAHVDVGAPIETHHVRPWATVLRVPVQGGAVWFKACGAVQAFEPRLSAALAERWPGRVADVIAYDSGRAWLLLADAGTPIGAFGNFEDAWLAALPPYAELQWGEAEHADVHLANGVPDLRLATLPARCDALLRRKLPLETDEVERLRTIAPRLAELCAQLEAFGLPETIQHDDLHHANVYAGTDGRLRVLDWGDSSVSHPFFSLVATYRLLDVAQRVPAGDPLYARLRDAYLGPWGRGLEEAFALGLRVGIFAHACAWARQRDHLPPDELPRFDPWFADVLRRAIAAADE